MKNYEKIKSQIEQNETYKQILKDSFGGIMYNIANKGKYQDKDLINLFLDCGLLEYQNYFDGIMLGVFNFLEIMKIGTKEDA